MVYTYYIVGHFGVGACRLDYSECFTYVTILGQGEYTTGGGANRVLLKNRVDGVISIRQDVMNGRGTAYLLSCSLIR